MGMSRRPSLFKERDVRSAAKAVRAAGSANGANHVPVLIPCHCVVRSDGSLGGYAYGLEIKQKLLEREKQ